MISIRDMRKSDINRVYEIECASFRSPWSKWSLLSEMNNGLAHYLLLVDDECVAGFCGMWVIFEEAHITNVALDPKYRGRGLSKMLMVAAMQKAVELGAESMTLEVRETNVTAQGLYFGLGFEKEGYRKHYYDDTGEGALLLWNKNIKKTLEERVDLQDNM